MRITDFKQVNNAYFSDVEIEFLKQSNYIESEYGTKALSDAMYAWSFMKNSSGFNLQNLLHCHRIMMVNIDSSIAGRVRDCDVWIGGSHKPFISIQLIKDDLEYLFGKMNRFEIEPKEAHIVFEYIHPFVDGNGRVGRMLYNAHRLQLNRPIHIIKESEKECYYEWFQS